MAFAIPPHYLSMETALSAIYGGGTRIAGAGRIAGGDINDAYRLTLTNGERIFMKANTKKNASFFAAEAAGLGAIAQTDAIGTPRILCTGEEEGIRGRAFLLMELIEGGSCIPTYWETFAHQLACMHRAQTAGFVDGGSYGFVSDNYIGAGGQENTAHERWTAFFRDCRLAPQFRRAERFFDGTDAKKINRLLDHIDDILVEPEQPSLLHGDLWSGNFITGNDGKAWLIDPAVYVGHAEADIAMTELFGGFAPSFYGAYEESGLLQPEYEDRRDLYNLYHLLNHLNLFGRSYLAVVRRTLDSYAP